MERERFKEWLALPTALRRPQLQQELAKELGVDEGTLSDWKREDRFWDDVVKLAKRNAREHTTEIVEALRTGAQGQGKASSADRKLWFQYIEEWAEKQEHQVPPGSVTFIMPNAGGKQRPKGLPKATPGRSD